jgi:hypothetical protein
VVLRRQAGRVLVRSFGSAAAVAVVVFLLAFWRAG